MEKLNKKRGSVTVLVMLLFVTLVSMTEVTRGSFRYLVGIRAPAKGLLMPTEYPIFLKPVAIMAPASEHLGSNPMQKSGLSWSFS